jgi:hypothetical protein
MDAFNKLLATSEPPELGPGPRAGRLPEAQLERDLKGLTDSLKSPERKKQLIRALILLWHDHLDTAHTIAQDVDNPDGAFVHGIMHRREPDYSNAKYWFRRVGAHPIFPRLAERVSALLKPGTQPSQQLSTMLLASGAWDPFGFVDACQLASKPSATTEQVSLLREIQRIETELLLEYFGA